MDRNFAEYIQQCLSSIKPLVPVDAGARPLLKPLQGIKAVFFDIYGTILISGSGDIDLVDLSAENAVKAFTDNNIDILIRDTAAAGNIIDREYRDAITEAHHCAKQDGIPFPEVDIINVWEYVTASLKRQKVIRTDSDPDFYRLSFDFEMLNNPVYPMPGLKEVFRWCSERAELGLITNSQFFSPIILNYFLTGEADLSGNVAMVNNGWNVFSFRLGRGKPDVFLYEKAVERISESGIVPEEVLFVGNDMLKDMYPAASVGFKTALFAGDRRSLRWRSSRRETSSTEPDVILTRLDQLKEILA